ncbi:hypothetical protein AMJ47_00205 [Parcubacteria bacterium DG_72]|nr:MAG: hypothetical protein AMJ47_00205 [Parcubacteria bacterium DG_72]
MEAKKRAVACLIGGIFGMLVAFAVKQAFEWLWIAAGMIAGASLAYLCYDLSQVFEKAPIAWKITKKESSEGINAAIKWFKKPHPFFYSYLIALFPSYILARTIPPVNVDYFEKIFVPLLFTMAISILPPGLLVVLIEDIFKRKKFFLSSLKVIISTNLIMEGEFQEVPFTYKNFFALAGKELGWKLLIILKTIPKIGKIILWLVFYEFWVLLGKFVCMLIKLIHSKGRVASAFYSALAIFISCLLWGRTAQTPTEYAFAVISAGVIGATFGSVSCKISQRLGLVPNK